jgi:PhnB protein
MKTSIQPFLTVRNGKNAVAFYVAAFGAIERQRFDLPGDRISSVIEIDGAEFYVGDEEPEYGNLSPSAPSPVRIILHTSSADAIFEKAVQHGAEAICPMTTEDDWRIGKLKDPFGHIWEIGFEL